MKNPKSALILAPMPKAYKNLSTKLRPKGVSNRNGALKWIYEYFSWNTSEDSGVIYFADDDNTYDIRIFEEVLFILIDVLSR